MSYTRSLNILLCLLVGDSISGHDNSTNSDTRGDRSLFQISITYSGH